MNVSSPMTASTSIHIEELTVVTRDTKLGPEEITASSTSLANPSSAA